jgi:hypothetical protein
VEVTPDSGTSAPVGAGIFQYSSGGVLVTESGIPSAARTRHARVFVDNFSGHDTGLAIARPRAPKRETRSRDWLNPMGIRREPLSSACLKIRIFEDPG